MHRLKPNTEYKMPNLGLAFPVHLAMPASLDDAEITDGLNEMLRAACLESNGDFIADWSFPADQLRVFKTAADPQEGDPFPA